MHTHTHIYIYIYSRTMQGLQVDGHRLVKDLDVLRL